MRYYELLEAPIGDLELLGDPNKEGSFRTSDLRAINHPKWRLQVRNAFAKTPFMFNVYLVNGEGGMVPDATGDLVDARNLAHLKTGHHGHVPREYLSDVLGLKIDPTKFDSAINIVLLDNEGDERLGLSPWILAHRICHAVMDSRGIGNRFGEVVTSMCNEVAETMLDFWGSDFNHNNNARRVAAAWGTMKSARDGSLEKRPGEFVIELATQYLVQGKITFKSAPTKSDQDKKLFEEAPYWEKKLAREAKVMFSDCVGYAFAI